MVMRRKKGSRTWGGGLVGWEGIASVAVTYGTAK